MHPNPYIAAWRDRVAGLRAIAASVGIRNQITPHAQALIDEVDELRAQQERLVARSQSVLDAATREGRELTAEERRAVARRTSEVEALEERIAALDAELDKPAGRKTARDAGATPSAAELASINAARAAGGQSAGARQWGNVPAQPVLDAAAPGRGRFVDLFGTPPAASGFGDFADFVRAVAAGDSQRLRAAATGMGELVGQDGGYMVPPGFTRDLLDASFDAEVIRPRARVLPLMGRSLAAPMFTWRDRTAGPAGLVGYWAGEGDTLAKQKAKVAEVNFVAKKLTVLVPVTHELLYDAGVEAGRYIKEAMGGTIAAYFDRAFFLGSGAGQPLGIINGSDKVAQAKEGSQAAATINFENVSKMVARLHPASFTRSVWLAHPSTLPQLMQLQIKVKNVAGTENVGGTVAPIQVGADGSITLMTRPVILTDLCSALGTEGDLVLADFSAYAIAMQPSIRFAVAPEFGFDKDETYFRAIVRCDGQPIHGGTTTLRTGSDAVAHFVTLETRG